MKQIFTLISLLVFSQAYSQYKVTLEAPQYDSGKAYLAYHMGKSLNVADSGQMNAKGVVVFKGDKTLPGGIYSIVFPGRRLSADFFIDKGQQINIKADTTKLLEMAITGSPENDRFQAYQKFVAEKGPLVQQARRAYTSATNAADSAKYEAEFKKINKEISDYRNDIVTNYPESMMAVFLNAMKDPVMPEKIPVTRQDSIDNYQFYKNHYWDGVTFDAGRPLVSVAGTRKHSAMAA